MKKPANPAIELYNYWLMVLEGARLGRNHDGRLCGSLQFGRDAHMGIATLTDGDPLRPHIGFGYAYSPDRFILNHEGHFRMVPMHGYKVRNAIERNTFLTWHYDWGQYHWTTVEDARRGPYGGTLRDWQNPIPYTPEWAMGLAWPWRDHEWLKLVNIDGGWHMKPVSTEPGRLATFEHAERLRTKRYQRSERQHLRAIGALPPPRQQSLTADEREERPRGQPREGDQRHPDSLRGRDSRAEHTAAP